MLERAFKEGCEHGYKKAMREAESYNERKTHTYNSFCCIISNFISYLFSPFILTTFAQKFNKGVKTWKVYH